MDYTTFENLFIAIMTPLSVGFTVFMVAFMYWTVFWILVQEYKQKKS